MIIELRIESDGEQPFLKRHRMRFQQIGPHKRARTPGGIHNLRPKCFEILGGNGSGRRSWRCCRSSRNHRRHRRWSDSGRWRRNNRLRLSRCWWRHRSGSLLRNLRCWSSCTWRWRRAPALPAQHVQLFQHRVNAHRISRFDGAEQRDFQQNFLRRRIAQAQFCVRQHFQNSRQCLGVRECDLFLQRRGFGFGNFHQTQVALRDLKQNQIAEVTQQIGEQTSEVFAFLREIVELMQRRVNFAREHRATQFQNLPLRGETKHREHIGFFDFVAAKTDELIERGFGIAHPAVRPARNSVKCRFIHGNFFFFCDVAKVVDDERRRNASQIEALAARKNGRQHLFGIGRGEHEFHVRRRLFERLEQRVERRRREHVHLVDDVDLELAVRRNVLARLAQLPHLLDAVVARAVNFQHIHRTAFGDFLHARVVVVEIHFRPAGAVEAFGKNARNGRFPRPARSAKQIRVRNAVLFDGVGERVGDVLLTNDVLKPLRAVFAGDDLIGHDDLD